MSEHKLPIEYLELISTYLSGNASDLEVEKLEKWVSADPKNKAHFISMKKAWVLSGLEQNHQLLDVAKEWSALNEQLSNVSKVVPLAKKKQPPRRIWLRIAAALALVLAASLWIFNNNDGSIKVVAHNKTVNQNLPDGTVVSLNQFSSITYTPVGTDKRRKVELKGDAFFEVARDEKHPFVINTGEVEVEVLGTSFYVDSRDDQSQIQVIVQSGSVAVRNGSQEIVLALNETGIFNKSSRDLLKLENQDPNYLAWKSKLLQFEESRLADVVFALNRQYHAQISFENAALENCKLTATYNDKTLDAVLRIIEKTLNISSRKEGKRIILFGEDCE